jgi:N-acetylglucosamine kinase-like BadF-type ATPase
MTQQAAVLAIDGGNTKTEVALVAADGSILARVRGGGVDSQLNGIKPTIGLLGDLLEAALREAGPGYANAAPPVVAHISACLANVDLAEEEQAVSAAIAAEGWAVTNTVVNDTFAVLRSGLHGAERWGIAVTCGAGINSVAVAPDGRTARFLALGEASGDYGGGMGMGRKALWLAMRGEDGRGQHTELSAALPAHFGVATIADVALRVHRGVISADEVTHLVPLIFAVAGRGDAVAASLVRSQAQEIFTMARVLGERLKLDRQATPIILGGGVLAAGDPLLIGTIKDYFAESMPLAQIHVLTAAPILGAALLGLDQTVAPAAAEDRLREQFAASEPGSRARVLPARLLRSAASA